MVSVVKGEARLDLLHTCPGASTRSACDRQQFEKVERLETALNNMAQGQVMFDTYERGGRLQRFLCPDVWVVARHRKAGLHVDRLANQGTASCHRARSRQRSRDAQNSAAKRTRNAIALFLQDRGT
jgi:hypothetical protein